MKRWFDRLSLLALTVIIVVVALTSLPALFGGHLAGTILLLHMMASGALVVGLPIYALLYVWRNISRFKSAALERLGFWLLVLTGVLTIASIFLCMLPIPSTDELEQLIQFHGYAGFAMVPALAILLWGAARMKSTRSATPG